LEETLNFKQDYSDTFQTVVFFKLIQVGLQPNEHKTLQKVS